MTTDNTRPDRLYNLDYLRGLAAFAIMLFHYLILIETLANSDTMRSGILGLILSRIGVYGVSVFYVLSGLTLYHVYFSSMKPSIVDVALFAKKRALRIFPLLWLATILTVMLGDNLPSVGDLAVILSGLFSIVKWKNNFPRGVWSIGNELVFYALFPVLVLITKKSKALLAITTIVFFSIYVYIAFVLITPGIMNRPRWRIYSNPLNQAFLFVGGYLIGHLARNISVGKKTQLAALAFTLGVFTLYPTNIDFTDLFSGPRRLVFTLCCIATCFCFYKLTIKLPTFIHKPLTALGEASYSLYLLHPVVFHTIEKYDAATQLHMNPAVRVSISVVASLLVSYLSYHCFEKFFIRLGKHRNTQTVAATTLPQESSR